jgi:hypothetical protein
VVTRHRSTRGAGRDVLEEVMHMFAFEPESVLPFMVFSIPIIAIVGGITAGIVKTLGRQRLAELQQQERLAAIQRGIDPSKLPPLNVAPLDDDEVAHMYMSPADRDRRRAQGLLIGGVVTTAAGIGIMAFLTVMERSENAWAVGIIPASVGVALLLCAWIVRPKGAHS